MIWGVKRKNWDVNRISLRKMKGMRDCENFINFLKLGIFN